MKTAEITIQNQTYTGTLNDSDLLFFISTLFDAEELKIYMQGQMEKAVQLWRTRSSNQYQKLLNNSGLTPQQAEQEFESQIAIQIFNKVQFDPNMRSAIASRIRECFPTVPQNLVYWNSTNDFGIRLESTDLMSLFASVFNNFVDQEAEVTPKPVKRKSFSNSKAFLATNK